MHLNYKKNWIFPKSFLKDRAIESYLNPIVEENKQDFKFGIIDFNQVKAYCIDELRWS